MKYTIDLPPRGLGQNSRMHWRYKAQRTKEYGDHVWVQVMAQGMPDEPIERSRITIDAYICRRLAFDDRDRALGRHTQYRPRDETNLADALKPAIDALIGIVIVDDDAKHCRVEMPYIHQVDRFEDERIELNVAELQPLD